MVAMMIVVVVVIVKVMIIKDLQLFLNFDKIIMLK